MWSNMRVALCQMSSTMTFGWGCSSAKMLKIVYNEVIYIYKLAFNYRHRPYNNVMGFAKKGLHMHPNLRL